MPNPRIARMSSVSRAKLASWLILLGALTVATMCVFTAYARAMGRQADDDGARCRSNLKQYALGLLMYSQDYDELFPPMKFPAQVENRVYPYIKNRAIYQCPVTMTEYQPNPAMNYMDIGKVASPTAMVILRDAKAHPADTHYWNVAYLDGHVVAVTKEPVLGKPAPTPPPLTRAQQIAGQLQALRQERQAIDKQILALEKEQRKLRNH